MVEGFPCWFPTLWPQQLDHETKLLPGGYGKKKYKNYVLYLTVISLGLTEILQNVQS